MKLNKFTKETNYVNDEVLILRDCMISELDKLASKTGHKFDSVGDIINYGLDSWDYETQDICSNIKMIYGQLVSHGVDLD